jgi:hypothetical protein
LQRDGARVNVAVDDEEPVDGPILLEFHSIRFLTMSSQHSQVPKELDLVRLVVQPEFLGQLQHSLLSRSPVSLTFAAAVREMASLP